MSAYLQPLLTALIQASTIAVSTWISRFPHNQVKASSRAQLTVRCRSTYNVPAFNVDALDADMEEEDGASMMSLIGLNTLFI